ncbi:MAG: carbohydrate-binding protein [Flavobacteriaceae bacterium]|nr:carbohydrate-binding protein [Flavobacteriaceae bacterium]
MKKLIITFLISSCLIPLYGQNIRALGTTIVDENQDEVLLRGVGLGGWMLQEGYMMNSNGGADTQHEFKEKLNLLVGADNTNQFYQNWLDNFITEQDINAIADWGFNSVRVALHYNLLTLPIEEEPVEGDNTWLEAGFERIDELMSWCSANNIYLILDLHAAPGGQGSDAAISDYDPDKPSLWESELNRDKTIALWGQLADRYKDEPWMGGYGLLNEVNWWPLDGSVLRAFYIETTQAIRAVDQNHIIFIGGNSWSNDFSGLTPPWDSNLVYEFHKYWSYNDTDSIQWVLDMQNQHNIPLWCGETGENSNVWYKDAMSLYETNNIGWSCWPYKRIATTVAPYSVSSNPNYEAIINFWKGEGPEPSVASAMAGLNQLTDDILLENNTFYKDVVDAYLRQPQDNTSIPYAEHTIPGLVYLSDYDLGTNGIAYYDQDVANYSLSTDQYEAWNRGWAYRNDGVDIQENSDTNNSNGLHLSFIEKDEWVNYTVNVLESGFYNIDLRYATTQSGGQIKYLIDGNDISEQITLSNTGGWNNFTNHSTNNIYIGEGIQTFQILVTGTIGFNMSSLNFSISNDPIPAMQAMSAVTVADERSVNLALNHPLPAQTIDVSSFEFLVNEEVYNIESIEIDPSNNLVLIITLSDYLHYQDNIKINHTGGVINSDYNSVLGALIDFPVENNLEERFYIPGLIQAESFTNQSGLVTENTTDAGGGLNIGYTDVNDYAEYPVFISQSGIYDLNLRVAAQWQSGQIEISLIENGTSEILGLFNLPVTGGWQSWVTSSNEIDLVAGVYTLKVRVAQPGFNFNWMELLYSDSNLSTNIVEVIKPYISLYPNPVNSSLTVKTTQNNIIDSITLFDISGRIILVKKGINSISEKINLSSFSKGSYYAKINTRSGEVTKKIIKH